MLCCLKRLVKKLFRCSKQCGHPPTFGMLIKVKNQNPMANASEYYYKLMFKPDDQCGYYYLLFTERELRTPLHRAVRNPEDLSFEMGHADIDHLLKD